LTSGLHYCVIDKLSFEGLFLYLNVQAFRKDDLMKKLKYLSAALAFLLVISVLVITGCKNKNPQPAETNAVSAIPGTTGGRRPLDIKLADPNSVAATVNGVEIKEKELQEIIAPEIDRLKDNASASTLPAESLNAYISQIRADALQQTILRRLLDPKLEDANIVVTEAEAESIIEERLAAQQQPLSMEDFKKFLEEDGRSYEGVIKQVREGLVYERYVEAQVADQTNVTEEEAKKFYDDNPKLFETPEQVRASHILVKEDPNDPNEAKQKIENLLRQVKNGADFADLAKANSEDIYSAPQGGDLQFFPRGAMEKPFEDAAFALEPGQVSDVVKTRYGYHIIKVTDHKDASTVSFEEIKNDIINYLKTQKLSEAEGKYYKSLISEAAIKFPEGKELKTGLFSK
jgi:peptidyl-prolyl cis-trans isomerase C